MDQDDKTIDITPRDYRVKEGKRREPFFNWEFVWPFLGFLALAVAAKLIWLWAMGRL